MNLTDNNDPAPSATAVQIVTKVVLLAHQLKLPNPVRIEAGATAHLDITFDAISALEPWLAATGLAQNDVRHTAYRDGGHGYWVMGLNWAGTGWSIQVRARVEEPEITTVELDADTVAGLEAIAGPVEPKPLVSDATIAEAEQVSKMVAPMDLHLPHAPCGCPIKGDELSTYVDHCGACKEACGRCERPFDPADKRHDGAARHGDSRWCKGCIDRCHEGGSEHRCPICAPAVSA